MNRNKELKEIISNDPFGLLTLKPTASGAINSDERLLTSFHEINNFYERNGREPEPSTSDISEHQLYFRLKGLRENKDKITTLKMEDKYGLLDVEIKSISNLDDIFEGDELGILDSDPESIFNLKHVKPIAERQSADYVARRKPCKNFENYEHLFKQIHSDINTGQRKIISFRERNLQEGNFYIANGIMVYVEKIQLFTDKDASSSKRIDKIEKNYNKIDGRTRCIYENGTESDLLFRSLVKTLEINGESITKNIKQVNDTILDDETGLIEDDVGSGYIYILKSKSDKEEIANLDNLYKIGYSKAEVSERIKNAENDPTYLMAPVSVITYFECYNVNPQKLEHLLHRFFGDACLSIDVYDNNGVNHSPREWFIAPLNVIEKAVELIINGRIIDYKYDRKSQSIISK